MLGERFENHARAHSEAVSRHGRDYWAEIEEIWFRLHVNCHTSAFLERTARRLFYRFDPCLRRIVLRLPMRSKLAWGKTGAPAIHNAHPPYFFREAKEWIISQDLNFVEEGLS
jgi:hypothetical protein